MDKLGRQTFILSCLFIVVFLLFQFKIYIATYIFILMLLITLSFFQEKNRIFIWSIIAFFFAQFLLLYGDRWLESINIPVYLLPTLKSCLLLLHCGFILYITKMFSFETKRFFRWPTFFNRKNSIIIGGMLVFIHLFPLVLGFPIKAIAPIAIFAIIYSVISETLWRGLLFTLFISNVGEMFAVFFTSLLFGLHYFAYGFSILGCLGFGLLGVLFAKVTIRFTSIIPAIFLHFTINIIIISFSMIFRPIFMLF